MKGFRSIFFIILAFFAVSSAWALKTKFDPTIFENDLKIAGIRNVVKVQADLGLPKDNAESQELVIKHVITTGRNMANRQYMLIDIKTLENIRPRLAGYEIIRRGKQVALTNAQMDSVMAMMQADEAQKKWLGNKHEPKYINVVLQVKDSKDDKISPVTTREASSLVAWAIKNQHRDKDDHPVKAEHAE